MAAKGRAVTPDQCREARRLLGWSVDRLGAISGTSAFLVLAFEESGHLPGSRDPIQPGTGLAAVRSALEAAGVEFTNGDSPGVRLRRAEPDA
jgi:hypothetical protein